MDSSGLDLARARILVTNDDGISAPGLKVLERIARACSKDVWVVAPHSEQSAASHSLTLRRPLRCARDFRVGAFPSTAPRPTVFWWRSARSWPNVQRISSFPG